MTHKNTYAVSQTNSNEDTYTVIIRWQINKLYQKTLSTLHLLTFVSLHINLPRDLDFLQQCISIEKNNSKELLKQKEFIITRARKG